MNDDYTELVEARVLPYHKKAIAKAIERFPVAYPNEAAFLRSAIARQLRLLKLQRGADE